MQLVSAKRIHLPEPKGRQAAARMAVKELAAALKAGQIHPELSEHLRLLPTDTLQAKEFQAAVNQIYQMLVKAGKVDSKDSQFLLFDDRQDGVHAPNAFYLPSSGKLFGFAAGYIRGDKAVTYDEFAHVVLHELFHRHVREKHLGADAKVNKFEEGSADLYTLYSWMRDVGANPRIVVEALSRDLSDKARGHGGVLPIDWSEVDDVHVSKRTTRLLMEGALTALEIRRGDCPDTPTPISDWRAEVSPGISKSLIEIVSNYDYVGPVKSNLTEAGYYTESEPVKRAEIFCKMLDGLPYCNPTRAGEAAEALLSLRLNPANAAESKALDSIADSILRVINPDNFNAVYQIYSTLCLRTANFEKHQPLGRLKTLADAANSFIKAKNRDDAIKFAANFVTLATAEPLARADWFEKDQAKYQPVHELCGDGFPRFAKCTVGGIVPWNKHMTECVLGRKRSTGWQDVVRALRILGVEDPRVWQESSLGSFQGELLTGKQVGVARQIMIEMPGTKKMSASLDSCYVFEGKVNYHEDQDLALAGRKLYLALQAKQWREPVNFQLHGLTLSPEMIAEILSKIGREHPEYCSKLISAVIGKTLKSTDRSSILTIVDQFMAQNSGDSKLVGSLSFTRFDACGLGRLASSRRWNSMGKYGQAVSDMVKLELIAFIYCGDLIYEGGNRMDLSLSSAPFRDDSKATSAEMLRELDTIVLPLASRALGRQVSLPATVDELPKLFSAEELERTPFLDVIRQAVGCAMLKEVDLDVPTSRRLARAIPKLADGAKDAVSEQSVNGWCKSAVQMASIQDEVKDWLYVQEQRFAPAVELFHKLGKLVEETEKLGASSRMEVLEMLLSSSMPISDIVILKKINGLYSAALLEKLGGIDDSKPEYFSRLDDVVKRLAQKVPIILRRELFAEIADRLCTQQRCSFLLRDNLNLFSEEQITLGSFKQLLVDGGLNVLAKSPELRGGVIDLLMSAADPEIVDKFIYDRLSALSYIGSEVAFGGTFQVSSDYTDDGRFTITTEEPESLKVLNRLRSEARKLHESFWEVPLYVRAAFVAELYFPDGVIGTKIDAVADAILTRAIPDSAPGAEVGRAWWKSYILGLPPYKIPYYLAATLSARRPGGSADRKAGDIIADIADILDPVARKLVQVGSGHPGLPEVLRPSPERVRCELSVPTRWEYWQLIDSQLSPEMRADLQYLGPVKKAGSISVAGSVISKTYGPATLLVEREYVRETSATGTKNLRQMVASRGADPAAAEVSRSIDAANSLLLSELDSETLPQKAAAMAEEYAKYKIVVDGKEVTFSSAELLRCEAHGKLLRTAPGTELAAAVQSDQSPDLRLVLMGVLTRELVAILSGSRFCDDRHSGNCNELKLHVEHFDYGGMAITPPNSEELSAFGDVIAKALSESAAPDEILPRLTRGLTHAAVEGSYIARVRKALQTLAEYTLYLPKSDVRACFGAAVIEMHPLIKTKVIPVFFSKVAQPEFSALIGSFMGPGGLSVKAVRYEKSLV